MALSRKIIQSYTKSYQRTWAAQLRHAEVQPTFYFAMYWVKSFAEVVAIVRNGRGVRGGTVYKERLNGLAKILNIIRQPFAKHQVAEASDLIFPLPIMILGSDNCIGWRVIDKNGEEHEFSRVYLAERFIKQARSARCSAPRSPGKQSVRGPRRPEGRPRRPARRILRCHRAAP
jgi:hypothetical protein